MWWQNKNIHSSQLEIEEFEMSNNYKYGDIIIFKIGPYKLKHSVYERYLIFEQYRNLGNGFLFDVLGISKYILAEKCYGYHNGGNFPSYNENDYDAMNRIVKELKNLCKDVDVNKLNPYYINSLREHCR